VPGWVGPALGVCAVASQRGAGALSAVLVAGWAGYGDPVHAALFLARRLAWYLASAIWHGMQSRSFLLRCLVAAAKVPHGWSGRGSGCPRRRSRLAWLAASRHCWHVGSLRRLWRLRPESPGLPLHPLGRLVGS